MKTVVLASGAGTLLQSLIDNDCGVVSVVSDNSTAEALTKANKAGIDSYTVSLDMFSTRDMWDYYITDLIRSFNPDWDNDFLSCGAAL